MQKLYDGKSLMLRAPAGGVTKGTLIKHGSMVLLPAETAKEGENFTALFSGIYGALTIHADGAPQYEGEKAFLKAGTSELTTVAAGNAFCGYFVKTDDTDALHFCGLGAQG